jgi:cytochrome c553
MFRKKTLIAGLAIVAGVMLASAGTAMAQAGTPTGGWAATDVVPAEDVRNTKHNFFSNQDVAYATSETTEICVFCHTPHGGRTDNSAAPLWNRALPASAGYTLYSSPNFDAVASQPQGVSLACLSCHDGTIGIDALINAPGSGGFLAANKNTNAGGVSTAGVTDPTTMQLLAADQLGVTAADGSMNDLQRPDCTPGSATQSCFWSPLGPQTAPEFYVANYTAALTFGMAPFPNLTTDLSDDHPISMQVPSTDPQFDQIRANFATSRQTNGITLVSRSGTAPAFTGEDIRDKIRTYPNPTNSAVGEFVECASCHNPHTPRPLFLRLPSTISPTTGNEVTLASNGNVQWSTVTGNAGDTQFISHNPNFQSAICLSCHSK